MASFTVVVVLNMQWLTQRSFCLAGTPAGKFSLEGSMSSSSAEPAARKVRKCFNLVAKRNHFLRGGVKALPVLMPP